MPPQGYLAPVTVTSPICITTIIITITIITTITLLQRLHVIEPGAHRIRKALSSTETGNLLPTLFQRQELQGLQASMALVDMGASVHRLLHPSPYGLLPTVSRGIDGRVLRQSIQ
jgi:hypothetical protein